MNLEAWLRHSASMQVFNSNPFELVTLFTTAKKESPEKCRAPDKFLIH
ncbi:hypothetical protein [Paraglaciecola sp.]